MDSQTSIDMLNNSIKDIESSTTNELIDIEISLNVNSDDPYQSSSDAVVKKKKPDLIEILQDVISQVVSIAEEIEHTEETQLKLSNLSKSLSELTQ
jgi:hypothetical protein